MNKRLKNFGDLDMRQQCRNKLSIWYGSRSNYYHGLLECMMNANDEMINNPADNRPMLLLIDLYDDNKTVAVHDFGGGIPIAEVHDDGTPMYKKFFEKMFSGSNLDNALIDKEATGTNGCGLTVLNYTSEFFTVISKYNNQCWRVDYKNGGLQRTFKQIPANYEGEFSISGSSFIFKLDETMYPETEYKSEEIMQMCNCLAGISNGLTIKFTYNKKTYEYCYNSLLEYIQKNCVCNNDFFEFPEKKEYEKVTITDKEGNIRVIDESHRMKLVWSVGADPYQESFLNCAYLKEKGTIFDGVIKGFQKVLDKYSDNKVRITTKDIELGLNFVFGFFTNNVEYVGQTKFMTQNERYKIAVINYVKNNLESFRLEHEKEFNEILKHFVEINKFNKKAEDEIKSLKQKIRKKTTKGLQPKVEGLIDCDMRNSKVEERILIIDEGLSANSTILDSRDPLYMGCIGLRGRFINSYKTTINNVFKNEPAIAIMSALGCGIELQEKDSKKFKNVVSFNKEDLRYGSIAIICDADSFGKAITLSLLCFFHKFYPTLCEEGRIYIVSSPRFVLYDNKNITYYAYNENEKNDLIKKLGKKLNHIGIVKGLGELNKDEFWDYVLSPEARKKTFIQVDFSGDKFEIENMFDITMGENINERKEFIVKNVLDKSTNMGD